MNIRRPRKSRPNLPGGQGHFFYRIGAKQLPIDHPRPPAKATIYYRKSVEDPANPGATIHKTWCCWTNNPDIAYFLVENMEIENLELNNLELFLRQQVKMGISADEQLTGNLYQKPNLVRAGEATHTVISRYALKTLLSQIDLNHATKPIRAAVDEGRRALIVDKPKSRKRRSR